MTHTDVYISETVREKRGWFIALGIILILIGGAAIVFPHIATLSTEIFIGWLLIIGGVAQIIHAFGAKGWRGIFWEAIIGLLVAIAGLFLLVYPVAGIVALTIYLAAIFLTEGIFRAYLAFKLKPEPGWVWMLIGGIISVVVGLMLWVELPASSIWAIGLLVGIDIMMAGWALVMIASAVSNEKVKV